MNKVIIVGGGAAGMLCSIIAARNGCEVFLYEKNEKLGKKLYITGKGRCNVTNNCEVEDLLRAVMTNSKFLYSAFYTFNSQDMMALLEETGVPLKTERGNRVFPQSDRSSDIIRGLERLMKKYGVHVRFRSEVREILTKDGAATGISLADGEVQNADAVVVATGGLSYPTTGSTGDGYRFARETGHQVTDCIPSLVPLKVKEDYIPRMTGLSLKNVELTVRRGKKILYRDFGEMMFTHTGVTGPLILSASSYVGKKLKAKELTLKIDLKPALSEEQLDHRVLREFEENQNRQFKNAVHKLFPSKLIPVMIELSGIDPEKKVNVITKEERLGFVRLIKNLECTLTGLRDYNEAIITKGGIKIKEVDPGTMESRLVKGLHFAGEVLDLDAVTGGFNLQIAWSTAYAAGTGIESADE